MRSAVLLETVATLSVHESPNIELSRFVHRAAKKDLIPGGSVGSLDLYIGRRPCVVIVMHPASRHRKLISGR
jgi:hypothetical protein